MHAVDSDDDAVVAGSLLMLGQLDVPASLQRHRR
jgi:hypothetical protein